jgi:hypothetical protein
MQNSHLPTMRWRRTVSAAMAAIIAFLAFGLAATSARAEDDWRRQRDERARHERDWRNQERREHGYVYAPPPVYYAPPAAPPAINFVFPLNIR